MPDTTSSSPPPAPAVPALPAAPAAIGGDAAPPAATVDDDTEASFLDTAVQGQIGRQLRSMYDSLVEQPVPDRFLRLLEELERKGHTPA